MKQPQQPAAPAAGYRFFVPGKPQPWQRAGHVGAAGRFYTPHATRAYQNKVRLCAVAAGVRPISGPVAMTLAITFPDRRTRDDDNVEKAIRDALQGRKKKGVWVRTPIAFEDDRQVRHMVRAVTEPDPARPGVVVTLKPLACSEAPERGDLRRKADEIARRAEDKIAAPDKGVCYCSGEHGPHSLCPQHGRVAAGHAQDCTVFWDNIARSWTLGTCCCGAARVKGCTCPRAISVRSPDCKAHGAAPERGGKP